MQASSSSSASPRRARRHLLVCAVLAVAGCTESAYDRPGTWRPTGANDQNLRAMLAQPQDADLGRAALTARGDSGGRAVTRLLVDKRRALLNASVSKVGGGTDAPADTALSTGGSSAAGAAAQ